MFWAVVFLAFVFAFVGWMAHEIWTAPDMDEGMTAECLLCGLERDVLQLEDVVEHVGGFPVHKGYKCAPACARKAA